MNIEADLIALNEKSVKIEQAADEERRREEVRTFFESFLSNELIFRRAGGDVIGKYGDKGFLAGLSDSPFESRDPEDFSVKVLGNRALVTLLVVARRKNDHSVHRYRNIRLFTRSANNWILELWYNYEITGL